MDNRTPPYIDLKRSLNYPHGSLSPRSTPEPRWRIEARLDADHFSRAAICLLIAFILIAHALFFYFAR